MHWEDAEHLTGRVVSDTTARERRDDWIAAGVFEAIATEAISGYDKIIGLDFSDVAVDGLVHKSPAGGEGTGKSPVDRAKRGWKWSIATDTAGVPLGWSISAANVHDVHLLAPTLDVVAQRGLIGEIGTLWLDRGYDGLRVPDQLAERGIDDAIIAKHREGRPERDRRTPSSVCVGRSSGPNSAVVQLRPAPAQHRPQEHPPLGPTRLGDRHAHHGQAHRLARQVVAQGCPYPLRFLSELFRCR